MLNLINTSKEFLDKITAKLRHYIKEEIAGSWFKNVFSEENTRHRFHLVSPSPWPLFASMAATTLLVGLLFWMHFIPSSRGFHHPFVLGSFLVLIMLYVWFRDVIREGSFMGFHTKIVQKGLKIGFILFLVSEIMFFFCLFWAYFHSSLNPSIWIGGIWPPEGIIHFYVNETFNSLIHMFHNPVYYYQNKYPITFTTVDPDLPLLSPLTLSEYVYFLPYDPTAVFDRVYLFYQNMFFYAPLGKIPLTQCFFFDHKEFERNYFKWFRQQNPHLFLEGNTDYRVGSAYHFYYSRPLITSVEISSSERYDCDKYVFFMFFIKEVLKESSIYINFLELGLTDLKSTETFLSKKINTVFLNLFYKFYQAPAVINYWTHKSCIDREILLYPKAFASNGKIYNQRALFTGEENQVCWPRFYFNLSPYHCKKEAKNSLKWYLHNVHTGGWLSYFNSCFKNYTFHFLDTFSDKKFLTDTIGSDYELLKENYTTLFNTSIFDKVKLMRNFFFTDSISNFRFYDFESRYFLENYDILFGLDKNHKLKSDLSGLRSFNTDVPKNLMLAYDINFFDKSIFKKITSKTDDKPVTKKILINMFKRMVDDYSEYLEVLFFSNKNFQIGLKHFYGDMEYGLYDTMPKFLTFLSNKEISLNLNCGESKVYSFGSFFKHINTIESKFYKKHSLESDPLVAGSKIYYQVFKIFAYRSQLFDNYNYRWFLNNITFEKESKNSFFTNYDPNYINTNFFSYYYALPNLMLITSVLSTAPVQSPIFHFYLPQAMEFYHNVLDCFYESKYSERVKTVYNLPFIFFNHFWKTPSCELYVDVINNFENIEVDLDDEYLFLQSDLNEFENAFFDEDTDFLIDAFSLFLDYDMYLDSSYTFLRKLRSRSFEREDLFSNFINNKIDLYYKLYDIYMGGMSVFSGRFVEYKFKRFVPVYFVLSVFDKGLLIDPNKVPWVNTVILITSGLAVTVSHIYFKARYKYISLFFLALTIALSFFFLKIQMFEYIHAGFAINDGIYGSVFYMLTGFHGFHVLVGTIFLIVCFFRIVFFHFIPSRHIAFEFAIWYWHFVDVIWIGLYFFVYYWPNNYFFNYHRMWHNYSEIPTDGIADYSCVLHYPMSVVYKYIIDTRNFEVYSPRLRPWKFFRRPETIHDVQIFNYQRKLMALCKYDMVERASLLTSIFINPLNLEYFNDWDNTFFQERSNRRIALRDIHFWWFWENLGHFFRNEFREDEISWWYILMEIIYTGVPRNRSMVKRTFLPYWDI